MNEPNRKETLEREALGYIQLGTLVQRRRSAERAEQVAQVLALNLPVDEKIRRIERIDAQPLPAGERRSAARSPATVPDSPSKKRMKESVIAAARHRARRKADVIPSTFMKYLLKEGREIRAKAKANAFIKAGIFKLTLESEPVRLFLEQTKRSQLPQLSAALDVALKDGWRFLRKEQYNLLATLKRLVTELDGLQPQPLSQGYASPSRRLFGIEIAFLAFISYRDAPAVGRDRLFGLEELLPKLSFPEKEGAEALAAGNLLLKNGGPPPCLQDFILALNMVRSRRHLTIADLLRPEGEALVSATEFDCGDEVQDAIDDHVASLLVRLDELGQEGEETLRLRAFVRRREDGNVDFAPLESFYESEGAVKRSWEKDGDNVIALVSGLIEEFLSRIEGLLVSSGEQRQAASRGADAKALGQTALGQKADEGFRIDNPEIEYDASRLRTLLTRTGRTMTSLPSLPWARFLAIRAQAVQATKYEADGVGIVIEAADGFYRIGCKLAALLRARAAPAARAVEVGIPGLSGEPSLEDLAFRSLLSTLVSASFLAALRLQEPTIGATLKNERQAEDQRRSVLEEIERIADGTTYRIARGKASPAISEGD